MEVMNFEPPGTSRYGRDSTRRAHAILHCITVGAKQCRSENCASLPGRVSVGAHGGMDCLLNRGL